MEIELATLALLVRWGLLPASSTRLQAVAACWRCHRCCWPGWTPVSALATNKLQGTFGIRLGDTHLLEEGAAAPA